jgi:hypothetical protein
MKKHYFCLLLCILIFVNMNASAQNAPDALILSTTFSYNYDVGSDNYKADQIAFALKWRPDSKFTVKRDTSQSDSSGGITTTPGVSFWHELNSNFAGRFSWSNSEEPKSNKTTALGFGIDITLNKLRNFQNLNNDVNQAEDEFERQTILSFDLKNQQYTQSSDSSSTGVTEKFSSNTWTATLSQDLTEYLNASAYYSKTNYISKDSSVTTTTTTTFRRRTSVVVSSTNSALNTGYVEASWGAFVSWNPIDNIHLSPGFTSTKYVDADNGSESSLTVYWDVSNYLSLNANTLKARQGTSDTQSSGLGFSFYW